jgi:hypothetical protein
MVHGNAEEREACLKAWRESVHRRRLDIGQEWMECRRMARSVVDAMVTASPERGRDLARLAFESWSAAWTRSLKEGDADELTAVVVLDCLLSANLTDELATFEKQMLNTFSEYGSVQFRTTLGRLRACRDCLGRGEQKFPAVAIEVLDAAPEGGPPRVRWAMEIPTELSDKARIQTMVVDGEKAGAPYKAPALHALSGKYDLEIHVGASPDAMRKIAGAEAVPAQGEMTIQDLPASGWVRVLVKNPRNGLIAIGPANPYCITRAELHSKRVPQGPVPVWPHEVRDEFGTPLSEVTPVEKGMEYLLRVDLEESDSLPIWSGRLPQGLNLVVMDEKQKPIAKMAGFDTRGVSDDLQPSMRLLRPGGWAVEFGDIFEPDGSILRPDVSRAHYLVFTASGALDAGAPAVRLQKFRRYEEEVMPRILPEADVEFMGNLGMEAVTWFISNARPRAVMGGQGGIRVYDTSKVPWELIRSFESPVLKGHESVFMFDDRQVFCLEWPRDGRPDSALRVVPLDTNLPYEELPRQVLPVNPRSSEVAVDESGVVFTVSSEGAFRTKFRALWLSSDGSLLDTTAERPSMEGPSEARVAWWGKDGSLGIAEGGRMFHLRVTKDALTVEKQDPGVASFDSVPTDAVPSSHLWQPRFILKDARLLLRLDQRSGEVVAGCRLPLVCRGSPIWMADENSPALLTTDQGELVRVIVPQK